MLSLRSTSAFLCSALILFLASTPALPAVAGHPSEDSSVRPAAVALMLLGAEAVPDLAVKSKVVQYVDVGSGIGVHGNGISRHQDLLITRRSYAEGIIHGKATVGMRDPELIARISQAENTQHALEVLHAQIVNLAARNPTQGSETGLVGQVVEGTDFILRTPGTSSGILEILAKACRHSKGIIKTSTSYAFVAPPCVVAAL